MRRTVSRIAAVRTLRLEADLLEPYGTPRGLLSRWSNLLIQVRTDDGAEGWGECAGPAALAESAVTEVLAPAILGQDALQTEVLWSKMWLACQPWGRRGGAVGALSGIDMALWDLKGKVRRCSASELFGGRWRETVPCAVSALFFREGPEAERIPRLLDEARELMDSGYRAIAVQLGRNLAHDRALIRALRKAMPDAAFTAEAHGVYDLPEAMAVGRVLEENGFAVFEEPLSPEQPELYSRLARGLRLPLAAGRVLQTRFDFERLLAAEWVGVAQLNVAWCGGPSEALRIRAAASSQGINLSPVTTGSELALAASLHFLASDSRQPGRLETPPPLLRRWGIPDPLRRRVFPKGLELEDGVARVPQGDGWGVAVDIDGAREFCVAEREVTAG